MIKVKREGLESDGDQNIITQLRKCANLRINFKILFENDDHVWMDPGMAAILLQMYESLRTTIDKEIMLRRIARSFKSCCDYIEGKPDDTVSQISKLLPYNPKYFE